MTPGNELREAQLGERIYAFLSAHSLFSLDALGKLDLTASDQAAKDLIAFVAAESRQPVGEARPDWRASLLGMSWIPLHIRHEVIRNLENYEAAQPVAPSPAKGLKDAIEEFQWMQTDALNMVSRAHVITVIERLLEGKQTHVRKAEGV